MNLFYTKTYNLSGENADKQSRIAKMGWELGMQEISLFRFDDRSDSDEELRMRLHAITTAVPEDGIVFLQYPTMVGIRYDQMLIEILKKRRGVQLIIVLEGYGSQVCPETYFELEEEKKLLRYADLMITFPDDLDELHIKRYLLDAACDVLEK